MRVLSMWTSAKSRLSNLRSPIFVRIAAGVFICILLIEAILLLHSWAKERDRLLSQLDGSLIAMTSLLDKSNPKLQLDSLIASPQANTKFRVIGYAIGSTENSVLSGGDTEGLATVVDKNTPTQFAANTGIYNTLLPISSTDGPGSVLRLRIDANWINQYMTSYIWRILFMIVLISLFVTVGCLMFLTPLLVNPLQRLNQLLVRGRKHGIRNVDVDIKDLSRTDELGSVFHSFNILRKALVHSEDARISLQQRSEEFANLGADCFWELDDRLKLTYLSGDVQRLLSIEAGKFIGLPVNALLSEISDRVPESQMISGSLKESGVWEGVINSATGDQTTAIKVIASTNYSSSGQIAYIRGTVIDVNEQVKLADMLRYQAIHDELTGLYNRRELSRVLAERVTEYERDGNVFTYVVIDLDRFKIINDTCGHAAGDMLLKSLSKIIAKDVDSNDIVARTGGDEFALILNGKGTEQAIQIASDIRSDIENYRFHWDNDSYSFTASIGLAEITNDLLSAEAIAFAADSCCLEAKKQGKNQIRAFSDNDSDTLYRNKDEALWISKIKNALTDNKFALFKQEIVQIGNPAYDCHFEILLRMRDDEGGFCSPGDFLPVAERNGLMSEIDQWVVTEVGNWFNKSVLRADTKYCVSVNLSPASLASASFREFLLNWTSTNQKYTQHICFEVTESAAMMNLEETIELLDKLRELGCRIALDDFGTGFSSLAHIRELPLDYIKIDGAFVRNIENNSLDQAVVKSVADIARVLHVGTIAEFVETDEILSVLSDLQIDFAQGFLFSKPEPLDNSLDEMPQSKAA